MNSPTPKRKPVFIEKGRQGRQDVCATARRNLNQSSVEQASSLLITKAPHLKIHRRRLPHWELDGANYFITFNIWERLELTEAARQVVLDACIFFNNQRYKVFSLVVMPDHVHWLIQPLLKSTSEFWSLSSIIHTAKSYSAKQIPKVMMHIGTVWQIERYDRIVRYEQEFQNTQEYIRQNPVKAGLSIVPEAYPFLWEIDAEIDEKEFSDR